MKKYLPYGHKVYKEFDNKFFKGHFSMRDSSGCGRFGGGWNWSIGFQSSKNSIIFNLLIAQLRIDFKHKRGNKDVR